MKTTDPNQALRPSIVLSSAIIPIVVLGLVQIVIIGVGVAGPA